MKKVPWTDERGRMYLSRLENHEPDEDAPQGILVGPPDIVDVLGLPESIGTALHNQLFHRGLFTLRDVQKKPQVVVGALQKALNVDAQKIMQAYHEYENPDTQEV